MAQMNVSIEMNDKLAEEFEETCQSLGLTTEEAMNIFARRVVNEKAIPFEINEEDYPDYRSRTEKLVDFAKKAGIVLSVCSGVALLVHFFMARDEEKHRFF